MAEITSKLVLLVQPMIMVTHELEPTFRELFVKYEGGNPTPKDVCDFLEGKGLEYSTDVGENNHGNTIFAFSVRGEQLFAIKML